MAEHDHTQSRTPDHARGATSRRGALTLAAGAFASVGITAGVAASVHAQVDDPGHAEGSALATFEDCATLEYDAWEPGTASAVFGDITEWLKRAQNDFEYVVLATAVMERDHHSNAKVAAEAPEDAMVGFAEGLQEAADRYTGLGEMLMAAHLRVLAGLSRHLKATGQEA